MRKMEAGPSSVSIWLCGETLSRRESVCELVKKALTGAGLAPWPSVEAECYSGGGDTLILARPGVPRPKAFWFRDLETLAKAVSSCPDGDSALYRADGGYLLVLPGGPAPLPLYEYSEERTLSPLWETHALEQETQLFPREAIKELKGFFSTFHL